MQRKNEFILKQIGVIKRSGAEENADWNDLSSDSTVEVFPRYMEALEGLEEYSHILIYFIFHKREGTRLKIRPEERDDMPEVGVFCTNSFLRPNPLAMSAVKIKRIAGNKITVTGLDALDGTPVVDIKPYAGFEYETAGYRVPYWLEKIWTDEGD